MRLSGYASVHRASSEAALTELAKSDATNAELSNTPRTAQAQEAAPPRGAETRKKPGAKRRAKSKVRQRHICYCVLKSVLTPGSRGQRMQPRKRAGGGVDPSILDAVMNAGLASGRAQQTAASAVLAGGDNASIYSANSLASTSSSERVLLPPPPQSSSSSLASARTPTPTGRPRTPVQLAPSAENATEASTSAAPAAASLEVPASDTPARPSSRSRSPRRMRRQRSAQSQEERGESASQPAAPSRQDTRGDTIDLQEARERMARIYDAQGDDPALPLPSTPPPEFEASPPPDDRREPSASYRHAVPLLFADDFPGALRPRSATRSRGERALAEVVLPQESLMGEATMRRPRSTSDASTSSAGSGSGSSAHAADDDEDEKVVRQLLRDAWEADRAAGLSISVRIKRDAARRHADVAQMPESEWESAPRSTDDLAAGQEAMWARVAQQRRSSEQSSTTPGPPSAQNDGGASGVAPQPSLAEGPATDSEEDEDEVITPVAQRPSAAAREEMARAAERRRQAIAESMRALEGGERRTAASQTSAGEITPTGTSMVNLSPSRSRSPVLRRTAPPAPASEDSGESESEDEDAAPSQPPPRITEAQTRPDRSSSGASAAGVEDSADERAARAQRRLSRAVSITARRRRLAETADQRMAHVTSVSQAAPEDAVIAEESESATPPLGAGDGSIEQGRIERRPLQQHTRAPPPPVPPSRILRTSSINSTNSRVGPPARSPPPPPPALSRNSSLTRPPPNPSILSYIPHSDRAGLTEPLVPSTVSLPVSSSSSPPQPRRPPPPPPPARSSSLRTSRPLPPQPFPSERPDSFTWMNTLQRQRQRQEQEVRSSLACPSTYPHLTCSADRRATSRRSDP